MTICPQETHVHVHLPGLVDHTALDAANASADATAARLAGLDAAVGDADSSDTPPVV